MIKIAVRADGNDRIGMGHIMRCMALAEELQKHTAEIMFFTRSNKEVIEKIHQKGFQTALIKSSGLSQEVKEIEALISRYSINVVITDSYDITEKYLDEIKKNVLLLVTIDDLNQAVFPSDIVINGNLYAEELHYRSKYGSTKFLLGPRFVLMRSEFLDVPERKIRSEVKNVLVTVGGSDGYNLTPQILKTMDTILQQLKITVVIGPHFLNTGEIREIASQVHHEVVVKENVNYMKDLMLDCDLAITAGGTTLYELAVTGTPAVVILQAENQIMGAEKLNDKGVIINLGLGNKDFSEPLKKSVASLINDYKMRKKMSCRGQLLVDAQGCRRCTREIMDSLKKSL